MYLRPVPHTSLSSWAAHKRRNPPSQEAGVDYYCRIGTPVKAPAAGRVSFTGDSIGPATGRYVTIDFDDGRRFRALHLSRRVVNAGQRVKAGQVIGYSGASGYGVEDWSGNPATGGAHVHVTLWPTHAYSFGVNAPTLDFERYVSGSTAGTGTPIASEEDDMTPEQAKQLDFVYKALAGPNNGYAASTSPLSWRNLRGDIGTANYGLLPIVINNQALIAKNAGELAAVKDIVRQLASASGAQIDMKKVEAAAERGAKAALDDLTITISAD